MSSEGSRSPAIDDTSSEESEGEDDFCRSFAPATMLSSRLRNTQHPESMVEETEQTVAGGPLKRRPSALSSDHCRTPTPSKKQRRQEMQNGFGLGFRPSANDSEEGSDEDRTTPLQRANFRGSRFQQQYKPCFGNEESNATALRQNGPEPLILDAQGMVTVNTYISRHLRSYQRDGIRFLYDRFVQCRGAVLNHDMGLGKTVQTIAFLSAIQGKTGLKSEWLQSEMSLFNEDLQQTARASGDDAEDEQVSESPRRKRRASLVVVPTSVLHNWLNEFDTWGYFSVEIFDKGRDPRPRLQIGAVDIMLCTYRSLQDHGRLLEDYKWQVIVYDEVHMFGNRQMKKYAAAERLIADCRIGLTGTPVQNNLQELWAILNILEPKFYNSRDFDDMERTITAGMSKNASTSLKREKEKAVRHMTSLLNVMMHRRTKDEHLAKELPEKTEYVLFAPMTQRQKQFLRRILSSRPAKMLKEKNPHYPPERNCPCQERDPKFQECMHTVTYDSLRHMISSLFFVCFQWMQKVANHPALFGWRVGTSGTGTSAELPSSGRPKTLSKTTPKALPSDGITLSDAEITAIHDDADDTLYCGKLRWVERLLRTWREETLRETSGFDGPVTSNQNKAHKVLVFSQFTSMLDILERFCVKRHYPFLRLDGSTRPIHRQELVTKFNKDPEQFVFLISLRAGAVGLNLTGANKVIIFEPCWNPTYDVQAQDRAFRIGQRRPVEVYRLISTHTVEEAVYDRQIWKSVMADMTTTGNEKAESFLEQSRVFGLKAIFEKGQVVVDHRNLQHVGQYDNDLHMHRVRSAEEHNHGDDRNHEEIDTEDITADLPEDDRTIEVTLEGMDLGDIDGGEQFGWEEQEVQDEGRQKQSQHQQSMQHPTKGEFRSRNSTQPWHDVQPMLHQRFLGDTEPHGPGTEDKLDAVSGSGDNEVHNGKRPFTKGQCLAVLQAMATLDGYHDTVDYAEMLLATSKEEVQRRIDRFYREDS
eukprot:Clim_evm41s77 gene=Clim_evmTU41s77